MEFTSDVELRRPDSAGRISIGAEHRNQLYAVREEPNGDIILSPVVVRHAREAWLFENEEALASVNAGLAESARGEIHNLGSFQQYLSSEDAVPEKPNKSALIRQMFFDENMSKSEIAKELGIRYQFVRNVIEHEKARRS